MTHTDSMPGTLLEPARSLDPKRWQQPDGRTRWLRRIYLTLVAASLAAGLAVVLHLLQPDSPASYLAAGILILCFAILFGWIAGNFWMAAFGTCHLVFKRWGSGPSDGVSAAATIPRQAIEALPRSAIAFPVYNEDTARVAAGVQSMLESLDHAGALDRFDFYILSDTRDPDIWIREEAAWMEIVADTRFEGRVFYRRRPENTERKSGNIKEFLENWGHGYRYMVVLDADSLMTGDTFVEMVRRMEADPEIGLLQTWPQVVGGRSLFARMHQYASFIYGRVLASGMAVLINPHGNYWGHNAIIRVDAFMQCCGLPHLPGTGPLGGEILSHDFVEAALLVRRGWKVELATDLGGSYEEGPPNIVQHIARDQRWCQGNLQHGWLLAARGMHPASRINFLTGMLAYLSSPIWLLFVIVTAFMALTSRELFAIAPVLIHLEAGGWQVQASSVESWMVIGLLGATITFILAPKLFGVIIALIESQERVFRLLPNVVSETILSILFAPTVMMRHSAFIVALLCGRGVSWKPQQRDEARLGWQEAWKAFWVQTVLAGGIVGLAVIWPSAVYILLSPILLGLLLSVPLAVLTGRVRDARGFLLTSGRMQDHPEILKRAEALRDRFNAALPVDGAVTSLLDDPVRFRLRLFFLATEPDDPVPESLDGGILAKARTQPADLTRDERKSILASPNALIRLHTERLLVGLPDRNPEAI